MQIPRRISGAKPLRTLELAHYALEGEGDDRILLIVKIMEIPFAAHVNTRIAATITRRRRLMLQAQRCNIHKPVCIEAISSLTCRCQFGLRRDSSP